VLFVYDCLGKNGISSHIMTLSESLLNHGWRVGLAYREIIDGCPLNESYMASRDIKTFQIPFVDLFRLRGGIGPFLASIRSIRSVYRKFSPTIIHSHGLGLAPLLRVTQEGQERVPVVSTIHADPTHRAYRMLEILAPAVRLVSFLFGDATIAISAQKHQLLRQLYRIAEDRIHRVEHGVDAAHFRQPTDTERRAARSRFGFDKHDFVTCILGRLYTNKQHRMHFEAVAQLRDAGVRVQTLVGGTGYLDGELQSLIADLGIEDRVQMLGFTDAREVLWASDVKVLPSENEGFALVIVEAMLCGVVPIRTPAGGSLEQIDPGRNGFLIPHGDVDALANRLAWLVRHPEERRLISRNAIETAQDGFTSETMVRKTLDVYHTLLATVPSSSTSDPRSASLSPPCSPIPSPPFR